ncbi:MAG: adenylyl-sulfate kinase, partial [Pedobacter sp.]
MVWFLLLFCLQANAQQPFSFPLPNQLTDVVYNIHQDSKGFVWLATNKGLMRYDGYEYQLYRSDKQTSVAGSNIQEDKYGRIWYQNFDGFLYYVKSNSLETFQQNTPVGFSGYGFTKNYLFLVQKEGVDIFEVSSLKFIKTIKISFDLAESSTVFKDNFYFIADNMMYVIDENFNVIKKDFFKNKKLHIKYIYPYKNESLFVVSKLNEAKEMYFFDENLKLNYTFPIPEINLIQGADIIDNHIWVHTSNGIYVYEKNGKRVYKNAFFPQNSSSQTIKDHQNNYWFSSVNEGVSVVPELNHKVYSVHDSDFMRFCKTNDGYLIGTENGEIISTDKAFQNNKILRSIGQKVPTYYVYFDSKEQQVIFSDLGFSIEDRFENIRRVAEIANLFLQNGSMV